MELDTLPHAQQSKPASTLAAPWQVAVLLIVAAIFCYAWFVYQYALNIPLGDDISDVLAVIVGLSQATDGETILALLFEQHNDHRTLSSRLVYYAIYGMQGEINFRVLTFIANLALPMLLYMLYLAIPQGQQRLWVLLPAAFLLFHLRAYGITLWPMAAFAYFYVFLYGFASLYCLHRISPATFALALVFASLSTFSLASGQMIWLVGLACLLQQALVARRIPIYYSVCWLLAAILVLAVWRMGMESRNDLATLLTYFLQTPMHHLSYFLVLLGSVVSEKSILAAWLNGGVMLSILILATVRGYRNTDLRLEWACWFIVLSVAAIVLGRAPYSTLEYALSSRYSFPSILMLSSTWVLFAVRLAPHSGRMLMAAVLLGAIFCATSYPLYTRELQPYMNLRIQSYNRDQFWIFGRPLGETKAIVTEAIELGIYRPPSRPYPATVLSPAFATAPNSESTQKP